MQKILTVVFVVLCGISVTAQTPTVSSDKGGWGVSVFGDFKVENTPPLLDSPGHDGVFYKPPFEQHYVYRQWSIGCSGLYTWYPLVNNKITGLSKVLVRFGLGGEFNRYGYNDQFLFNSQILLGYTFSLRKTSIDLYTGPIGKFAPKRRSYTGPYGWVTPDIDDYANDVSELPIYTTHMYTGGVWWSFGITLKLQHIGINVSYNQGLSDFEHYSSPERVFGKKDEKYSALNSLTVGLQYYFR